MRCSLSLLTAAVLAVAASAAADNPPAIPSSQTQIMPVAADDSAPPTRTTFRQRLWNLFHPHRDTGASQPQSNRIAPIAADKRTLVANSPALGASKDLEGVGHEKDYHWITGRLARVPGDSRRLMIRYAGPNEVDTYGGSMILTPNAELQKHHPGELVCIYGSITSKLHSANGGPGAVYQVTQVYVIPPMGAKK